MRKFLRNKKKSDTALKISKTIDYDLDSSLDEEKENLKLLKKIKNGLTELDHIQDMNKMLKEDLKQRVKDADLLQEVIDDSNSNTRLKYTESKSVLVQLKNINGDLELQILNIQQEFRDLKKQAKENSSNQLKMSEKTRIIMLGKESKVESIIRLNTANLEVMK